MNHYLLIAEKPDLMRKIKAVYQEIESTLPYTCDFTAQAGHLVGFKMPEEVDPYYKKWELDKYPHRFDFAYKVLEKKEELYGRISEAVNSGNYNGIIHAGDPDQEGEYLVRLVLAKAKNKLPVYRFWTNDLSEVSITKALQHLKPDSEFDPLFHAANIRARADYQFGMNISPVVSLKLKTLCPLGRVKAPILYLLVKREQEIRNYVEKKTYKPAFKYKDCEFVWDNAFDTPELATAQNPNTNLATVTDVKSERKTQKPPKLFKLSTLQVEAYKAFKISAADTLAIIQSLYEKQCITYPRSDCEYISTETDIDGIRKKVVEILSFDSSLLTKSSAEVLKDKSYCNNKAISTEGHTAIIPTGIKPDDLSDQHRKMYEMICKRFLAIFGENQITQHYVVTASPQGSNNPYVYKEKSDVVPGFNFILNPNYEVSQPSGINWTNGMQLTPIELFAKECISKKPERYNSGSLIKALDHPEALEDEEGEKVKYTIGTPATRAGIIEDLISKGHYFEDKKGVYYVNPKAEAVIDNYDTIPLFQPVESGRWESYLTKVRNGEASHNKVYERLVEEMEESTRKIKEKEVTPMASGAGDKPSIGKCPKCGADVVYGQNGAFCTGKCGMFLNKAFGKQLTETQVKNLLAGKSVNVKGFKSKSGKTYDATLTPGKIKEISYLKKDGTQATGFSWDFSFDNGGSGSEGDNREVIGKCPKCGGDIVWGKYGPSCANKCGMFVGKAMGKVLTKTEVSSLLQNKKTLVHGLKSKAGKTYNAYLTPTIIEAFTYKKDDGTPVEGFSWNFNMEFDQSKKSKK